MVRKGWMLWSAFVLAACGDDGGSTPIDANIVVVDAAVDGPPQVITVTGTVTDIDGQGIPNVSVYIRGADPVFSDATGKFSIADVEPPYDVLVTIPRQKLAVLYAGMTRPDPIINAVFYTNHDKSATINGTLAAGAGSTFTNPSGPTANTSIQSVVSRGGVNKFIPANSVVSPYQVTASWSDTPATSGRLHALQWTATNGVATEFHGYGSAPITLTNGGTSTPSITMQPVTSQTVSGSVVVPAGWTTSATSTHLRLATGELFGLNSTMGATFSHRVPMIQDAQACVIINAANGTFGAAAVRAKLAPPIADLVIDAPLQLPSQQSPAASTRVGPGTELRTAEVTGAIYLQGLFPQNDPDGASVIIVSGSPSVTIPDVRVFGLSLPTDASYSWNTFAFTRIATSMDEAHRALLVLGSDTCSVGDLDFVQTEARLLIMN